MLVEDIERVVKRIPGPVQDVLRKRRDVFLAGGFVRAIIAGEKPSDLDLFVSDADRARGVADILSGDRDPYESQFAFNTKVWGTTVQVIHAFVFSTPTEVLIDNFDFTISQAAIWYDGDEWDGEVGARFYQDLAARRLRYDVSDVPRDALPAGGTLLRLAKFLRRGYSASPETLAAVALHAASGLGSPEPEIAEPVDPDLLDMLIARLREIDPLVALR